MPYYIKRKRIKPKRITKKTIKIYFWLTVLCLVIAALFSFITGNVPTFVREKLDNILIAEAEKTLGRKLKSSDLNLIEKTFGVKIDPSALKGDGPSYRGKIDDDLIDRARGAYKRGKINDDFVNRIKQVYRGQLSPEEIERARKGFNTGQPDPSDIERARQAYKDGMLDRGAVDQARKESKR